MKAARIFSLENLGLSIAAHAGLALLVVGFALVAPVAKVIAPDRIKIEHIDLRDVKITGLETKLRNQEAKAALSSRGKRSETAGPRSKSASAASTNKKQAPVVKTIKVNREVFSPDRTMTVSVIDALRIAMTRCWQIDQTRPGLDGIRAVAHIKLFPNGRVQSFWFEQASRADTDAIFAYVLTTIKLAIDACNPFSMLPRGEYDKWKSVQLSFFPTAKTIE
ncbi:MAG: hypothetical protein LBL46_02305 [Rickettsiales bacterium]|jgi:hypothetical protein|nr:hypothetical protein [Rickettsiales bacterium]